MFIWIFKSLSIKSRLDPFPIVIVKNIQTARGHRHLNLREGFLGMQRWRPLNLSRVCLFYWRSIGSHEQLRVISTEDNSARQQKSRRRAAWHKLSVISGALSNAGDSFIIFLIKEWRWREMKGARYIGLTAQSSCALFRRIFRMSGGSHPNQRAT